jgi:hypothetical protein
MIAAYRKLIVAVLGVAALLLTKYIGQDYLTPHVETIADMLIGLLTAFGVWGVKNDAAKKTEPPV